MLRTMSKSRVMALTSLVSQACRTGPSSHSFTPAPFRRCQDSLAAGARCMATKASTKKAETPVSKAQLVETMVAQGKFDTKVSADSAVSAVFDTIMDEVILGNSVRLLGFGTFANRSRAARKGRNPSTGAELDLPPSNLPAFTAGKTFKESVKAGKRTEAATKKKSPGRKKKAAE